MVAALGVGILAPVAAADPDSPDTKGQGQGSTDAEITPEAFNDAPGTGVPYVPFDPDYDLLEPGTTDSSDTLEFLTNVPDVGMFEGAINSNMAFEGEILYQGSYNGLKIYDLSDPEQPELLSSLLCPGGQGDLTLAGDLAFFSVDSPRSDDTCTSAAVPSSTPGNWEGIRIFDVSNPTAPEYVGAVQTRCGSHTQTLVQSPDDDDIVYLYNSAYDVSSTAAFCTPPHEVVEIIEVDVTDPASAEIVSEHEFWNEANPPFQVSDREDGGAVTSVTRGCHDLTSYQEKDLLAAACMGDGLMVDISDPENPEVLDRVRDENFAFWHTAQFNNDADTVIFQDELGGGVSATCYPGIPQYRGADAIYDLDAGNELTLASYFKIPRRQSTTENCVTHEGNILAVEGRDILVQAFYKGGVSLIDFTESDDPREIGYFDRGPAESGEFELGGSWAAYIHNGYIYSSEIAEGLDVLQLRGAQFDDAVRHRLDLRNPSAQTELTWPWKDAPVVPDGGAPTLRPGDVSPSAAEIGSQRRITITTPPGTYEAGEYVDVWTRGPRPRVLATAQARDNGSAQLSFDLPDGFRVGQRSVLLRGDSELDEALVAATVNVVKATSDVNLRFARDTVPSTQRARAIVRVVAGGVTPRGEVRVAVGRRTVTGRLVDGTDSLRLPRLAPGRYQVRATYLGSPSVRRGVSPQVTLTVRR